MGSEYEKTETVCGCLGPLVYVFLHFRVHGIVVLVIVSLLDT
jgi:hypothetical protein